MSDEDNIIREVEEDLRRERYERLWKKYGPFVIGTIVVVLVAMVGWQQYQAWQDRQRTREAEAFLAATDLLEDSKAADAAKAFEDLAAEAGTGYRSMARLYEAEAHLKQGNPEEALAAFDALAADGSADAKLRALAALKGSLLLADSAAPKDLKKRLAPALRPNSPWRYAAQEIVAYAWYRSGNRDEARNAYQNLVNEFNAPAQIRERARSMLSLIASEEAQGVGGDESGEDAEKAPDAGTATQAAPAEADAPAETANETDSEASGDGDEPASVQGASAEDGDGETPQ